MRKIVVVALLLLGSLAGAAPPAQAAVEDFPSLCPQMEDSIYRLYSAYFLREPDLVGWDYWTGIYGTSPNTNLEVISDSFAVSVEFTNRYGNLTNEEFVTLIYRNVLNREPDQEGFDHWVGALNRGYPRGSVMIAFSESSEYVRKTATAPPQAGYLMWYDRSLHFDCGYGFDTAAGEQRTQQIATPGRGETYVDIMLWNTGAPTGGYLATLPDAMTGFRVDMLNQWEYVHVYNIPVSAAEDIIMLAGEGGPGLSWSVVFHDRPHSGDRPGWDGDNWLELGPAAGVAGARQLEPTISPLPGPRRLAG